jgi:uncharacterized membrane protein
MKIEKITKSLIAVSVLATIFDVVRGDLLGKTGLLYLVWNLLLAWIPYVISSNFIQKDMPAKKFWPIFILWLLFFPNAPYLVTDVLHIASRLPSLLWYDSLLFFFFGWAGLLLGLLSLFHLHQYFKNRFSYNISEFIIFAICFVSSFGVYLGRFERWNSWDLFLNPLQLLRHSVNISTNLTHPGTPLLFMCVFTVFLYSIYRTVYNLIIRDEVSVSHQR